MTATFGPAVRVPSSLPDVFERGVSNTTSCPIYAAGTLVTPTSGSCSISGPGGAVVASGAVTIVSGVATYEWTPPASTSLGEGWQVTWELSTTDHGVIRHRNEGMIARFRGICPLSVSDLYDVAPAIKPGNTSISAMTHEDIDAKIRVAWEQVQVRLISLGRRPWLVIGSYALKEVTQLTALSIIYSGLQHRGNEAILATSQQYQVDLKAAWDRLKLTYDEGDAGTAATGKKAGGIGQLWIGRG